MPFARMSRDSSRSENQSLSAVARHVLERIEQRSDLTLAAIQTRSDEESVWDVVLGERERLEASRRPPFEEARLEVGFDPAGRLVPVLRVLRQELEDDRRERLRNPEHAVAGRDGLACVRVDPLQRLGCVER
jgi:predicted CopG family antitoxin